MTTQNLTHDLSDSVLSKVNDLIEINLDSERGFREAADHLDNPQYSQWFRDVADERGRQAAELQQLVRNAGEKPENDGSFAAKAHRWWINVRDAITTTENYDVLAEAERGEDSILEMYREAHDESQGTGVHSTLHQQHLQVKQRHDQVRDLRDAVRDPESTTG
jgi:uncharacterized protein (TIGR02284 family)